VFRAGVEPERPQKVGRGPLRSLRPASGDLSVRPDPSRLVRQCCTEPVDVRQSNGGDPAVIRWCFGGRPVADRRSM
jgi:hypothetical protein